jgi:glutathione S-transferase
MPDVVVLGFPRSTFVHIVRLVLTHKEIAYTFRDLEPEMGSATHLALHPFNRVPILQHGDFTLYETSAIAAYVDEAFDGPALQPKDVRARARMNQWISAVNSYYYPYMIYHVSHERRVFPELGIPSDEKVVAHALPKIEVGLQVLERQLGHGKNYLLGSDLTLADFYVLPSTYAFGLTNEGKAMYPKYPAFCRWREGMEALATVRKFRAALPPHAPIEHARQWAVSHRPKY